MAEIGHAYLTLIPTFGGGGKLTKSVEGMLGKAYSNTGALSSKAGAGAASAFGGGFLKSGAIRRFPRRETGKRAHLAGRQG